MKLKVGVAEKVVVVAIVWVEAAEADMNKEEEVVTTMAREPEQTAPSSPSQTVSPSNITLRSTSRRTCIRK